MEGFESGKEATDLRRWKLQVDEGRQVWQYIDGDEPVQQSLTDKYALGLLTVHTHTLLPLSFLSSATPLQTSSFVLARL
jgi:hypothetical protein